MISPKVFVPFYWLTLTTDWVNHRHQDCVRIFNAHKSVEPTTILLKKKKKKIRRWALCPLFLSLLRNCRLSHRTESVTFFSLLLLPPFLWRKAHYGFDIFISKIRLWSQLCDHNTPNYVRAILRKFFIPFRIKRTPGIQPPTDWVIIFRFFASSIAMRESRRCRNTTYLTTKWKLKIVQWQRNHKRIKMKL